MTATEVDCGWCSEPATGKRFVTPPRYRGGELVHPGVRVGVCDQHAAIFERADMVKACLEQRDRLRRILARPGQGNREHIEARLKEVAEQLRELGHVEPAARRRSAAA